MSDYPVIGSIKTFADVKRALDSVRSYFKSLRFGNVISNVTGHDSHLVEFSGNDGKGIKDGGLTHADTLDAINKKHTQGHAITSASDHTSTATSGQMLKANANGLPVDASNTDAQVSGAVSASHARAHDLNSDSDHNSALTEGKVLKADANGLPAEAANTDAEVSGAVSHKSTEDAINGLVAVDGAGGYSAKVIGTDVQAYNANTLVGSLNTGETGNTVDSTKSVTVTINGNPVKLAVLS